MTSKSEPPAPPPCEACESHDRKCKSQCSIDRMTHHAEIAELRALVREAFDDQDDGMGPHSIEWMRKAEYATNIGNSFTVDDGTVGGVRFSHRRKLKNRIRAALAPKSSAGGGGD